MRVNPEAQLAVKLYERKFQKRRAEGDQVHVITCDPNMQIDACRDAATLCSIARAIHRLDEAFCNRELTKRELTRRLKLKTAAGRIAGDYGIEVRHNSDPRGYSLYLHFPDGSYNSCGGSESGWGI